MSLKQKILDDFKVAFKEKNEDVKRVLGMVKSMILNEEINRGQREAGLDDEGVLEVIRRAIKQRKDSIEQFKAAGRAEMAQDEEKEVVILTAYLPAQMSDEELKVALEKIIEQTGAKSAADLGKTIGVAMKELKDKVDGARVRQMLTEMLK